MFHLYHVVFYICNSIHVVCIDDFSSCATVQVNDELLRGLLTARRSFKKKKETTIFQSRCRIWFAVAGALEPDELRVANDRSNLGPLLLRSSVVENVCGKRQMIMPHLVPLPRIYIQSRPATVFTAYRSITATRTGKTNFYTRSASKKGDEKKRKRKSFLSSSRFLFPSRRQDRERERLENVWNMEKFPHTHIRDTRHAISSFINGENN